MARIRTIKPEFWDDLKIAKISRDARLLYIGMWNFADDLGVIIGDSLWIKSKVFPFDQIQIQQFDKWKLELVKSGFISQFSHSGEDFYYLPNLTRHQVINRPNLEKVNVKQSDLEDIVKSLINHGTLIDASHSGEEGKGVEEEKEKEHNALVSDFENFRKKYPGKKRGLEVEFENFKKKNKDWRDVIPLLIPALEKEIAQKELQQKNNMFCPSWKDFTTWINKKCWTQEFEQFENPNGSAPIDDWKKKLLNS